MSGDPVAVIGAGLAGAAVAAALARIGRSVDLFHSLEDMPASRLPMGVLRPHLAAQTDPLTRVRERGLRVTHAWLAHLARRGIDSGLRARGGLLLPTDDRSRRRRDRLPELGAGPRRIGPEEALAVAGISVPEPVVIDPSAACIAPSVFAAALLDDAGDRIRWAPARVQSLRRNHGWHVECDAAIRRGFYSDVVVAAGAGSRILAPGLGPLITPARGQATAVAATRASARQTVPISGDGYVTPAWNHCHWTGATIQRGDTDPRPRELDDQENLARFGRCRPHEPEPHVVDRFVAIRATTPDRIPITGRLEPGLWVSAGHGAHGLCTAPLSGLLIAAALSGKRHRLLDLMAPERPALARIGR